MVLSLRTQWEKSSLFSFIFKRFVRSLNAFLCVFHRENFSLYNVCVDLFHSFIFSYFQSFIAFHLHLHILVTTDPHNTLHIHHHSMVPIKNTIHNNCNNWGRPCWFCSCTNTLWLQLLTCDSELLHYWFELHPHIDTYIHIHTCTHTHIHTSHHVIYIIHRIVIKW